MNYYRDLQLTGRAIYDVMADETAFVEMPESWHVVVADIANSTEAVLAGKHDDVNMIAAGCLIAALNIAKTMQVEIPYFFGGDGGVVLVPEEMIVPVMFALSTHKINSLNNFALDLRIGSVQMTEIKKAGYRIALAKLKAENGFSKPLLLGNGLLYAESVIKRNYKSENKKTAEVPDMSALNLSGMECRWDKVNLPKNNLEVVCFLIEAVNPANQPKVYSEVLKKIEEVYGSAEKRHPITINMLRFKAGFEKLNREVKAKYAAFKTGVLLRSLYESILAKIFFRFNLTSKNIQAKQYLSDLIASSEILTIDGRINTIVSGTPENRNKLLDYLYKQEQNGLLYFGHYVSKASIMTCYVESIDKKHTHFVDGSDGGYTQAARELKPKLRR